MLEESVHWKAAPRLSISSAGGVAAPTFSSPLPSSAFGTTVISEKGQLNECSPVRRRKYTAAGRGCLTDQHRGEPCVPGWLVDTRSAWHWEKTDTSCGLGLVAFLVDQNRSPKSCFEAQGCYHNSIFIGYPDSICDSGPK